MKMQASVTLTHGTTVAELNEALAEIPDDATITVKSYHADRPGETSYSTISFSWESKGRFKS